MARQVINIGSGLDAPADTFPTALTKLKAMWTELYAEAGGTPPSIPNVFTEKVRDAFAKVNTSTDHLFTALGATGRQVIDVGTGYDASTTDTIRSAWNKWNTMSATLFGAVVPPVSPSTYGPRSDITQPSGSILVTAGSTHSQIQTLINANGNSAVFWFPAGVYPIGGSITPKTGQTFVGAYGAILDGSGWSTSDDTQGAFRSHNQDIDNVTIKNFIIRKMPQRGIHAYYHMSNHWTIEYNEIANNRYGIEFGPNFTIRYNNIHHNVGNTSSPNAAERGGGYICNSAHNALFDSNEIAYNGMEQKVAGQSQNVTFRNNFVHHNLGDGIWYDWNGTSGSPSGSLIELNTVEDNGRTGITFEVGCGATIQNNVLRRNAEEAILISMSQSVTTTGNTLTGNRGGILYFLNCAALAEGADLRNNTTSNNSISVGAQNGSYAGGLAFVTGCTSTQVAPYLSNSKANNFSGNTYFVANTGAAWWYWPLSSGGYGLKTWTGWKAIPQDATGSVFQQ